MEGCLPVISTDFATSSTALTKSLPSLYVYVDNVSSNAVRNAVGDLDIAVVTAASLGFAPNINDLIFYDEMSTHFSGKAVVVTSDKGLDIKNAITQYQGKLTTITLSVSGKYNQYLALSNFLELKGFQDYTAMPARYPTINVSLSGNELIVNAFDVRRKHPRYNLVRKTIRPVANTSFM